MTLFQRILLNIFRQMIAGLAVILSGCSFIDPLEHGEPLATAISPQATLIFTATDMHAGFNGYPDGVAALNLSTSDDLSCSRGPSTHGRQSQVSAHQPEIRLQVPAGRTLILDSAWSRRDAFCIVGNQGFVPEDNAVYRVTNVQNRERGACALRLERMDTGHKRFVHHNRLRSLSNKCRARPAQTTLAENSPYDYR